ncbi:hypothetical protein OESDEN_05036 [Oesophagostomum dentatum]|uniref:Uncharacterized protein n=1 Tax=Oesophagostomum dentatum TaxID=61180 RepID=A0A0B1TFY6_OESDE|nr:hypothetical protein OESDEN_05036 [Oesophagostomum dentatum]
MGRNPSSNDYACGDLNMGTNENLAKFISELGDNVKQGNLTSKPGPSYVWTTVDIDIVDFTKRPDPPFTFVFHAKDEASQYSYACPMIGNQPEVVTDALMNLFYIFGPPNTVKLEPAYRGKYSVNSCERTSFSDTGTSSLGTVLETTVNAKFPATNVVFYAENRNKQGALAPRREETMIRERIYAWLMDNGRTNWFNHLNEIKHMHNSEWIDELVIYITKPSGGTPMELFFGRPRLSTHQASKMKPEETEHDDDAFSEAHTNNSNELSEDSAAPPTEASNVKSEA